MLPQRSERRPMILWLSGLSAAGFAAGTVSADGFQ